MKKLFKSYLAIWTILLVLFHVIAFAAPGWSGQEKYTASFWAGYVFIVLAFAGQLVCAHFALKDGDKTRLFYHLPLLTVSRTGLILTFVFGGACMLLSPLPYWVGMILCAATLAFTAIAVIKADAAAELVNEKDEKLQANTFFVKSLTADAQSLLARAKSDGAKAACKRVYEAARYSDPVSHPALADLESALTLRLAALSDAVAADNAQEIARAAEDFLTLLTERNNKCKLMK